MSGGGESQPSVPPSPAAPRRARWIPSVLLRCGGHGLLAAVALLLLLPQAVILWQALAAGDWIHVVFPATVGKLLWTTVVLGFWTVLLALVLGCGAAWCVTRCAFPGRGLLSVLLCLPFALPAYVVAGVADRLSHAAWFPAPNNLTGAVLIMALTLYPWVYLPVKATLAQQGGHYHDLALSLGMGPWRRWWRVELRLILPAVAVGALLVFMAVLNDYGSAQLLGVKTLSVAIYDYRFAADRADWAAQIALIGLALPLLAVVGFALADGRRARYQPSNRGAPMPLLELRGLARWAVPGALFTLLSVAFLVPLGILLWWSIEMLGRRPVGTMHAYLTDTLVSSGLVTLIAVGVALGVALMLRRSSTLRPWRGIGALAALNYAVPGIMLGIAMLALLALVPTSWRGGVAGLLPSQSIALLVLACSLAFFCFPFFAIRATQSTLSPHIDDLGRVLGLSAWRRFWRIDLPLLRRGIACGLLLVLVSMVKELPISQALQPFGYRSLSLKLFDAAGVGAFRQSAIYAVLMVGLVAYPVLLVDRLIMNARHADA